jgi:hypothetical protein
VSRTPDEEALTAEAKQLQALRDQLSQALAVLAPQNPKVKMLESQIAALEKIVADQVAAAAPLAPRARHCRPWISNWPTLIGSWPSSPTRKSRSLRNSRP